jgi:pimeloyl-ACP methyl ester carboxylesterase
MSRVALPWMAVLALLTTSCVKLDFFLWTGGPATLEDYDFLSEGLDGIPPDRITSELIPVGDEGDEIHVLYVTRDESKLDSSLDPADGLTVVFSHGRYKNMLKYVYRLGYWEDMGFNVAMYDYRGYGASSGEISEDHLYEDVVAVFDYVASQPGVGTVISVGYSLGGAPAVYLCSVESGREVAACIVEATFASVDHMADTAGYYDFEGSWFADTKFDTAGRAAEIDIPFMVMHGTRDKRIGVDHGRAIWKAVKNNHPANRFWEVEKATHNNIPVPSYVEKDDEPREYSHPDELPPQLSAEFDDYKMRIAEFLAEGLYE